MVSGMMGEQARSPRWSPFPPSLLTLIRGRCILLSCPQITTHTEGREGSRQPRYPVKGLIHPPFGCNQVTPLGNTPQKHQQLQLPHSWRLPSKGEHILQGLPGLVGASRKENCRKERLCCLSFLLDFRTGSISSPAFWVPTTEQIPPFASQCFKHSSLPPSLFY